MKTKTFTTELYETLEDLMVEHDLPNCKWGNDDLNEEVDNPDEWFVIGYHGDYTNNRWNIWATATEDGRGLTCFYLCDDDRY